MKPVTFASALAIPIAVMLACSEEASPSAAGDGTVARLEATPTSLELLPGTQATIEVTAFDDSGDPRPGIQLAWSTTTPAVATVSNDGVVTAAAPGNATIKVTAGEVSSSIAVRVVPPAPSGSVIEIHPSVEYQRMTGWEGVAQIGQVECNPQAFGNYQSTVIDRLVNELGVNRVRLELRSGHENPTDWYTDFLQGKTGWQAQRYVAINDNDDPRVANPAGFNFTELDYAIDAVVTPMRAAMAARGERLYVNLTYVDFGPSPFEHADHPEEYAELIAEAFKHLQSRHGWVPDALEVILEPDGWKTWRGPEIGAVLVAAGERLAQLGHRPALIAPSTASMADAAPLFDAMLQVPGVAAWVTDLSYHRYSGVSDNALRAIRDRAIANGIRTGMLEHIGSGYQDLHEDLKEGQVSSWEQFALAFCGTDRGGAYYIIDQSNPAAPVVTLGSRGRYLRQYFSFVRLDAVRLGATSGNATFDPVAFRNANGKIVVVIRATGSGSTEVRGLPDGTYGVVRTTAALTFASGPDVTVSGGAATFTMPATGVMTIVQR